MSHQYTLYYRPQEDILGESFYDWRKHVFQETANYLDSQGLTVTQTHKKSFEINSGTAQKIQMEIPDSMAILQNEQSGDYYVLDCHDLVLPEELKLLAKDNKCKKILKCQYRASVFRSNIFQKVRPWTYFDRYWPQHQDQMTEFRNEKRTSEFVYFRGADWAQRDIILSDLSRRGIIPADYQPINYEEYFRESCQHQIMLSLPGMADVCHRDIESFASGTCVLRPRLINEFHNKLIPDHHYISVNIKYAKLAPLEVTNKIEEKFREVANNHDLIESISKNAAKWYDENVRLNAAMKLTAQLLDLDADS